MEHQSQHHHNHHHHHHHQATHGLATVEDNRAYFDKLADTYDARHEKLADRLTVELQSRLDFIGLEDPATTDEDEDEDEDNAKPSTRTPVRLLDYACGTGAMSRALAPYVTQCVGIDVSDKMVDAYNKRAENQGLSRDEMFAVVGDLAVPTDPNPAALARPELAGAFDIAAVGGGFHHFEDPALAAERLAARLKPGGILLIWDLLPHADDHHHDAHHTVAHHGFSEEQMRDMYRRAGVTDNFKLEVLGEGIVRETLFQGEKKDIRRSLFLCRGQKEGGSS